MYRRGLCSAVSYAYQSTWHCVWFYWFIFSCYVFQGLKRQTNQQRRILTRWHFGLKAVDGPGQIQGLHYDLITAEKGKGQVKWLTAFNQDVFMAGEQGLGGSPMVAKKHICVAMVMEGARRTTPHPTIHHILMFYFNKTINSIHPSTLGISS